MELFHIHALSMSDWKKHLDDVVCRFSGLPWYSSTTEFLGTEHGFEVKV